MGYAMGLAAMGTIAGNNRWRRQAQTLFRAGLEQRAFRRNALFGGATMFAIAARQLTNMGLVSDRISGRMCDYAFDMFVRDCRNLSVGSPELSTADADLISGAVGTCVGLLHLGRTEALGVVRNLIERSASICRVQASDVTPEIKWREPRLGAGYVDLGLAHGVAGVLLVSAGLEGERQLAKFDQIRRGMVYLDGALVAQPWLVEDSPLGNRDRMGWCYGNAGTSWALAHFGREDALVIAKELLRSYSLVPPDRWMVDTHGLCHGLPGILLVVAALFQHGLISTMDLDSIQSHVLFELGRRMEVDGLSERKDGLLVGELGTAIGLAAVAQRIDCKSCGPTSLFLPTASIY
ncbi:lanthionine synthetase LanC family protein [Microlunatus sp. GCM10028923]|uniref:lanthionine synthetase LanC family protein n=1 Tax=Microlunatus sp. GCM10028923 TaxID=3273400 RepID=UPI00360B9C81